MCPYCWVHSILEKVCWYSYNSVSLKANPPRVITASKSDIASLIYPGSSNEASYLGAYMFAGKALEKYCFSQLTLLHQLKFLV